MWRSRWAGPAGEVVSWGSRVVVVIAAEGTPRAGRRWPFRAVVPATPSSPILLAGPHRAGTREIDRGEVMVVIASSESSWQSDQWSATRMSDRSCRATMAEARRAATDPVCAALLLVAWAASRRLRQIPRVINNRIYANTGTKSSPYRREIVQIAESPS